MTDLQKNTDSQAAPPYTVEALLSLMIREQATDLHLRVGMSPVLRIEGQLKLAEGRVLSEDAIADFVRSLCTSEQRERIEKSGSIECGLNISKFQQSPVYPQFSEFGFRISVFKEQERLGVVLSSVPGELLKMNHYPPVLVELAELERGIVLITGAPGSGRTTTVAAMINLINDTLYNRHVYTIEEPIEFRFRSNRALVTQREVNVDTPGFVEGIRSALKSDPDVLVVGEIRDLQVLRLALQAAEAGILVIGTLTTEDGQKAIEMLVAGFPSEEQNFVRQQLAALLKAVVTQVLVPRATGTGRVAAFEVLRVTPAVASNIAANQLSQISLVRHSTKSSGMVLLDAYLVELMQKGIIDKATVFRFCRDRKLLPALE